MNYEIHITLCSIQHSNIDEFVKDCKEIGVKPIVIETQNKNNFGIQVMTSSKHSGSHYLFTLNDLCSKLEPKYTIQRKKVEIQPETEINKEHIYYETHLRLKLPIGFDYTLIYKLCDNFNFHLSKNLFKKDENYIWQMITYRDYSKNYNNFENIINNMSNQLEALNIFCDKIEIEECVYDSNVEVDKSWLKND